jgi:hypothetical protein
VRGVQFLVVFECNIQTLKQEERVDWKLVKVGGFLNREGHNEETSDNSRIECL